MSEIIKRAFDAVRQLPQDRQEELARYMLVLSERPVPAGLSSEEAAAIAEAEAELARGERAPDKEIAALWRRHGA